MLQVQPGEDGDKVPKGPEIPQQRRITTWIMKQVLSDTPQAPTSRMGQMVQLHHAQSINTIGPTRAVDPRDYSILRNDMPHRDNAVADAPDKQHRLTYSDSSSLAVTAVFDVDGSIRGRRRTLPYPPVLVIMVLSVPWFCSSSSHGSLC
jgi:hypothetical protein